MIAPDLSVIRNSLAILGDLDPREGTPTLEAWLELISDLSVPESEILPLALAEVLPLLRSDPDRLRIALDLTTTFDLFETLTSLLQLLVTSRDPEIALKAAVLSLSPAAPAEAEPWLRSIADRIEFTAAQANAFRIRLDPAFRPESSMELALHGQVWPGSGISESEQAFPIVAIDELSGPAHTRWVIAADLVQSGAIVRRIPRNWVKTPRPEWLGPRMPIVAWTSEAISRLRAIDDRVNVAQLVVAPDTVDDALRIRILTQVNERLSGRARLRLRVAPTTQWAMRPLEPDVYRLGAFDSKEMAFLGSGSRSVLYKLKNELSPRSVDSDYYWSFNQLVALRTWQYFRATTPRGKVSTTVLKSLEDFAGAPKATRIGITATGSVLIEQDGSFVDHKTGQEVFTDFILLDKVFQPFTIGGGHVPRLLDPSHYTRVHPGVLGGTPTVKGRRIPARTIAELVDKTGIRQLNTLYPELTTAELRDAVNVGEQLLSV